MRNMPAKISKASNEDEIEQMPTNKKKHVALAPLFAFLKLMRAWGDGINGSTKAVDKLMYEFETTKDNSTSTLAPDPSKESRRRASYGEGRIENLRAGYRATPSERAWLHWAFSNVMGDAWASEITPDNLVELPLNEILEKGLRAELPWPQNIPAYFEFRSVLDAQVEKSALSVCYDKPGMKAVESENAPIMAQARNDVDACYEPGMSVEILVSHIPAGSRRLLTFTTSDQDFEDQSSDIPVIFDVTLLNHQLAKDAEVRLRHPDKSGYRVTTEPGRYSLYALAVPNSWSLASKIGFPIEEASRLTEAQTKLFLAFLKEYFRASTKGVYIAAHHYRV